MADVAGPAWVGGVQVTTTTSPKQPKQNNRPDSILNGRRVKDRGLRDRPRRGGLLALAGLLIVGSGLAGAVLFDRASDTAEVLAVRDGIAMGHTLTEGDLVARNVAGIDGVYTVDEAGSVIGATAAVDLVPGQVLTRDMLTREPVPAAGDAVVGLSLDPARVPAAGLGAGDLVDVIAVPVGENAATDDAALDAPRVLAEQARVYEVAGSATEGGGVSVTVVVPESAAARVAAYSTAGRVAVVETAPGSGGAG
jgi:hypothetical protein